MELGSKPNQILDYLYLGSQWDVNPTAITELNITHVLCVKDSIRYPKNVEFEHVPMSDFGESDLLTALPRCFEFIKQAKDAGGKCLVHCAAGVNRSASTVIGALMHFEAMTLRAAYDLVKEKRPRIAPHEKYFAMLVTYEYQLFQKHTMQASDYYSPQEMLRDIREKYDDAVPNHDASLIKSVDKLNIRDDKATESPTSDDKSTEHQ